MDDIAQELSGVLRDLALARGSEAALMLAEAFGGSRCYVPTGARMKKSHPIAKAVGLDTAMWLARHHGGDYVLFPTAGAVRVMVRNRAILADRAAGMTSWQLAKRHRLSRRQVLRVVADSADGSELSDI